MQVKHYVLTTGYHHVRAVGYAHLFAQWPVGTRCDHSSISAGEMPPIDSALVDYFIELANRAADQSEEDIEALKPPGATQDNQTGDV